MRDLRRFCAITLLVLGLLVSRLQAQGWDPVNPAELSGMPTPLIEKDAAAEAILWEVTIHDEVDPLGARSIRSTYIRVKVFSKLGVEQQSKVEIPYLDGNEVYGIVGRTIKPDGTTVELNPNSIVGQTLIKTKRLSYKTWSFVLPGVEPGSILEYAWTERRKDQLTNRIHIDIQRDIPVQLVRYRVKAANLQFANLLMKVHAFNMPPPHPLRDSENYWVISTRNVPAFHEEPYMPPQDQERQWMMLYYEEDNNLSTQQYWDALGKSTFKEGRSLLRISDDVKKAALSATANAATVEDKLRAVYDFCRASIRNIDNGPTGLTADQIRRYRENRTASDVLNQRMGTGRDILQLFGTMASALGSDVQYALIGNRAQAFFRPDFVNSYNLPDSIIAIKVDNDWQFFNPASTYTPFGMLPWYQEGTLALVADASKPEFIRTPASAPSLSAIHRKANLSLSANGTLEGDVWTEYTGHIAAVEEKEDDQLSPAELEASLKKRLQNRLGGAAEVSSVQFSNVGGVKAPISYTYHVRIEAYAQKTGKRLFFQPGYFEKGIEPYFVADSREHSIYFEYPWVEDEVVNIKLPQGFDLENADDLPAFDEKAIVTHDIEMSVSSDRRSMVYARKMEFTTSDLLFKPIQYPSLKHLFDLIHSRDSHALSLRQADGEEHHR